MPNCERCGTYISGLEAKRYYNLCYECFSRFEVYRFLGPRELSRGKKARKKHVPWGYYMMVILSGIFAILFFTWWAGITIILTYTLGWVFFIVALILISDYRSERQLKKEKDVIEN